MGPCASRGCWAVWVADNHRAQGGLVEAATDQHPRDALASRAKTFPAQTDGHPHHRRRGGGLAVRFGLAGVFVSDVRVVALRLRGIGGSACAASRTLVRTGWAPASALASTIATARSRSTGSASSQLWRSRASEGSGVTRYAAGTPSALASAWISREVGDARPRSYWLIRGAATLGDSPIRRPTAACEIPNASRAARRRVARTEPGPKGAATSGPGSHRGVHRMGKNARTR